MWGGNQLITLGGGGGDWVAHHVCVKRVICTYFIMTHIQVNVTIGLMSFGVLSLGLMSFGVMSFSLLSVYRPN